jgi:predicted dehydrogenase
MTDVLDQEDPVGVAPASSTAPAPGAWSGTRRVRIGILGTGGIATIPEGVLPNLHHIAEKVEVIAVADLEVDRARGVAAQYRIPECYSSLESMLDNADIDAVVNLTPIPAHAKTSLQVLQAGKHLVVEKPIATSLEDADLIIETAKSNGLTIVCAPPDMLFKSYTEARRLIDAGTIGKVAFARVRSSHGGPGGSPEGWPLDPSWFYQAGSGPLFDMGVYGIHEITGLLGPAKRVSAFTGITEETRTVRGPGPFSGKEITVTADDNCLFMLDFGGATFAVVDGTFNVHATRSPKVEIFGRRGVLNVYGPDNLDHPGGDALDLYRTDIAPGVDGWVAPESWPQIEDDRRDVLARAILVDHLADCLRQGAPNLLTAAHARHALEIMLAVERSSREGRVVELTTTF